MVFIKERSSLEKLKSLRRNVNWEIKKQRFKLLRQFYRLINNWEGPLPNLLDIFRPEEIEDLLVDFLEYPDMYYDGETKYDFIEFIVRTGYKDKPKDGEDGKPLLHRTTALHRAARWGRSYAPMVPLLFNIFDRFDVNYIDDRGVSHFMFAYMIGCVEAVEKFLELGQDPNFDVKRIGAPLDYALGHRSTEMLRLLLRYGADPNYNGSDSAMTPLHRLSVRLLDNELLDDSESTNVRVDLMEMIFEECHDKYKPVNVETRNKFGDTALHLALKEGPRKVAEVLLRRGADPNVADSDGSTALHIISKKKDGEVWAKMLFQVCDEVNRTVQVDARDESHDKYKPVNVEARNKFGDTALHLALKEGPRKVAEVLLRRGADPNVADSDGSTVLHIISKKKDGEVWAKMLFQVCDEVHRTVQVDARDESHDKYKPVNVEARNKFGDTALHLALKEGPRKVAEVLLRRGADPNVADSDGSTALHIISKKNDGEVWAKMLFQVCDEVNRIVQVDARDNEGRTPLQLAVANFKPDVIDVLVDRGADLSSFVFPTESYFGKRFQIRRHDHEKKLRLASGALAVVVSLDEKGYELDRSDALMIMKFFANYGLLEKPTNANNCWYDDEKFTSGAKKTMITPSLSLYDLIKLRPQEAARRLTFKDYLEFARTMKLTKFPVKYREACVGHLCEKISRGFFLDWTMEPFMELIHYRLPILCCDMVLEELRNEDLYSICLADRGQSSRCQ
uniref:Uncharacterized protein n=1 Tax=Trichogramma kaykai TaxID=54128 RepID=A0ABD2XJ07_9HYME